MTRLLADGVDGYIWEFTGIPFLAQWRSWAHLSVSFRSKLAGKELWELYLLDQHELGKGRTVG